MRFGKRQLQELLYLHGAHATPRGDARSTSSRQRVDRRRSDSAPGSRRSALARLFVPTPKDALASSLPTVGALLLRGVKPEQIVLQFLGKAIGTEPGPRRASSLRRPLARARCHHRACGDARQRHGGHGVCVSRSEPGAGRARPRARGRGATGDFHEGVNFAAVQKCPLIVVVVRYPTSRVGSEVAQLYERAKGYGLASLPVDGSDLLQVVQVVETAVARAQAGDGPTLIERRFAKLQTLLRKRKCGPRAVRRRRGRDSDPAGKKPKTSITTPHGGSKNSCYSRTGCREADRASLVGARRGGGLRRVASRRWRGSGAPAATSRRVSTHRLSVRARTCPKSRISKPSARRCGTRWSAMTERHSPRRRHRPLRWRVQGDRGFSRKVRLGPRDRYSDQRGRLHRSRHRRRVQRTASHRRVPVHRLHRQRVQHDHELRREEPLPVGCGGAHRDARSLRRGSARWSVPLAESRRCTSCIRPASKW